MPSTPVAGGGRQQLRGLATAAAVLVWIAGGPGPFAVFVSSFTFGASASTATAQAGMALLGGGLLTTYLGCAAAGVVVIMWLWRARANAAAAATAPQRWSEGWVIAGWLVPVVNLWVPAAVVSDVVRASAGGADPQADRLRAIVPFWWASWLGAWVALWAAIVGLPLMGAMTLGANVWFAFFSGLSALLFVAAAAAFTRIALRIADRQDGHLDARPAPGPGTGFVATAGAATDAATVAGSEAHTEANTVAATGTGTGTIADGGSAEPVAPPPPPPPTPPAATSGTPTWLLLAIVGVVVFAVAATGVALIVTDDPPADVVAAAIEDAREWDGANYRGTVPALDGAPIDFDLTVTATGARGTLSREGGVARAEIVQDGSGVLLKGNQAWWQHRQPERAELLADTWVADPGTETLVIDPILRMHPEELSNEVHPELGSLWEETGEQVVDGERAIVISNGFQVLIVTAEEPHRLLLIDLNTTGPQGDEPIRIRLVSPEQAAEVAAAVARIRITESPRTLTQWLLERPRADIQIQPEPFCVTRTCTATFTATNTGQIRIRGRFEMTADGSPAGTYPVDLLPGQSATFTATTANRLYNSPGATGEIYWMGQVVPA